MSALKSRRMQRTKAPRARMTLAVAEGGQDTEAPMVLVVVCIFRLCMNNKRTCGFYRNV